jgi:DNA-directed RNA polymerase I subunit RPA49
MDGVSSSKQHKIPNILRRRFSTMFAVSESRRMPPEKINLLDSYILVLTLFSDEFHTDYSDISKDLRMNKVSVTQIYKHLGCKILTQNGASYATLPIPLTFPQLRQNKRVKKN